MFFDFIAKSVMNGANNLKILALGGKRQTVSVQTGSEKRFFQPLANQDRCLVTIL